MSQRYLIQNIGRAEPNFIGSSYGLYSDVFEARVYTRSDALIAINELTTRELQDCAQQNKAVAIQFVLVPYKPLLGIGEIIRPTRKEYAGLGIQGHWSFDVETIRTMVTERSWDTSWSNNSYLDVDEFDFAIRHKETGTTKPLYQLTDIFSHEEFVSTYGEYVKCELDITITDTLYVLQLCKPDWNEGNLFTILSLASTNDLENLLSTRTTKKTLADVISTFNKLQETNQLYWTLNRSKKAKKIPIIKSALTITIKSAQLGNVKA